MSTAHQTRTGWSSRWAASRGALGALLAVMALAGAAAPALGLSARHSCAAPLPGHAACLALRVVPSSAAPQARTLAATPANERTEPWPGFLTPALLHAAYELPNETAQSSGQTIAVVDAYDDPTAESDLAVYDKQFGLPACTSGNGCFRKVNENGQPSPLPKANGGWASEITIDVQMAHAICQSCKVLLVEASSEGFSDLGAGVNAAVNLGATEVSNSYGGPEEGGDSTLASADYDHPGTVVTASSGDCGYLGTSCKGMPQLAEFPAAVPQVVAVGGTSLFEQGSTWTSETWSEGGSGCSGVFTAPLWQSAVANFSATGCGTGRAVADISAIGDPETGVDTYDSTPERPGAETGWGVWGGTSVASPIVAAEFALAGGAHSVAYPAATLYEHAGQAANIDDVTSGANGSCSGRTICAASAGFDGPTGLGSPVGLGAFAIAGTPESTSAPTISGYAEEGDTLTASPGSWSNEPAEVSLQWERCSEGAGCQAVPGAKSLTLPVPEGSAGDTIRVRETATNEKGSGTAVTAATGKVRSNVPAIFAVSPLSGPTGSTLTVEGLALDQVTTATVGGIAASFHAVSPTQLSVTVPNGAWKGKLSLATPHGSTSFKKNFIATLAIRSFGPSSAAAGTVVTIKGVGFNGSSQVSFNGTPATVLSAGAKKIRVSVPAGATAGAISVTNVATPAGTVYSPSSFTP